jgi:hypothetical protein
MRKIVSTLLSLLFMGTTGLALAQTTTAPAMHPHPRIHEVRTRIADQYARIKAGLKSGKLTEDQAKALRVQLKAVHDQMMADFQTNGKRELTEDQLKQLNQMLDENSSTIHEEKHPDGSTGSSSTGGSPAAGGAPSGSAPVSQ